MRWCLRQESNLYLALRRRSFYPLNYGGTRPGFSHAAPSDPGPVRARQAWRHQRNVQITSSALSVPDCARSVKRLATR